MDEGRAEFKAVKHAIDEFEAAVERHKGAKMLDNEVVLRQEVDRAREVLMTAIIKLAKATPASAAT